MSEKEIDAQQEDMDNKVDFYEENKPIENEVICKESETIIPDLVISPSEEIIDLDQAKDEVSSGEEIISTEATSIHANLYNKPNPPRIRRFVDITKFVRDHPTSEYETLKNFFIFADLNYVTDLKKLAIDMEVEIMKSTIKPKKICDTPTKSDCVSDSEKQENDGIKESTRDEKSQNLDKETMKDKVSPRTDSPVRKVYEKTERRRSKSLTRKDASEPEIEYEFSFKTDMEKCDLETRKLLLSIPDLISVLELAGKNLTSKSPSAKVSLLSKLGGLGSPSSGSQKEESSLETGSSPKNVKAELKKKEKDENEKVKDEVKEENKEENKEEKEEKEDRTNKTEVKRFIFSPRKKTPEAKARSKISHKEQIDADVLNFSPLLCKQYFEGKNLILEFDIKDDNFFEVSAWTNDANKIHIVARGIGCNDTYRCIEHIRDLSRDMDIELVDSYFTKLGLYIIKFRANEPKKAFSMCTSS